MDMDESIDNAQEQLEQKMEEEETGADQAEERQTLEQEAQAFLADQTHQVVIPSYAAWFDMQQIHQIEEKSNPEFFNGRNRSKTPNIYKDYRDFMINTYRLNPVEYLTVTACRRNLAGDVCAVMRVHAFLEQWGLINYQIDPETRPSMIGPPSTAHFRVMMDTPRGLQPLQMEPASAKASIAPNESTNSEKRSSATPGLELRRTVYDEVGKPSTTNGVAAKEKTQQSNCSTCGVDCSSVRYHSTTQKRFDLCSNCYHEGRFPSSLHSGDFIKMDENTKVPNSAWSDQETLLLLEGLEMYDEDWTQIAAHIGTRTKQECVLHFLSLPIEEPYLTEDLKTPARFENAPYSQADNPVMSVVAFLASTVDPDIAATSAKTTIEALMAKLKAKSQQNGEDTEMSVDSDDPLQKASLVALSSAAAKAHLLAMNEERKLQSLINTAVSLQLEKLDLKMAQFKELEIVLEEERRKIDVYRQESFLERIALKRGTTTSTNEPVKVVAANGAPSQTDPEVRLFQPVHT